MPQAGRTGPTPVLDAMFSRNEPLTGPSGTLAWAVDVDNPATGEAFTLMLKEITLPGPDGVPVTRPCALGFSGNYPRALDGLARLLSLDMRVIDPAWIGMKLRKLLNYAEPLGHFMAFVPGLPDGERRQQTWPSTVAYLARLIIHRYAMLGVLDERASRCATWACWRPRPPARPPRRWPGGPARNAATRRSSARTAATSAPPAATWGQCG
jgi:ribonucleoside-diphosphate reductase alpha chain